MERHRVQRAKKGLAVTAISAGALAVLVACGGPDPIVQPPGQAGPPLEGSGGFEPPWGGQKPLGSGKPAPSTSLPDGDDTDATPLGTAPSGEMSFFVTSVGNKEKGGNFGGVAGADAFCKRLADAAGATGKTWVAYVSTSTENAKDRIGTGPWFNQEGKQVAASVASLHDKGIPSDLVLSEKGTRIDMKNAHDVITGSKSDGTFAGVNCQGYRSAASFDKTWVGHADGGGTGDDRPESWNAAHETQGCDAVQLQRTASQAHLYCFAK